MVFAATGTSDFEYRTVAICQEESIYSALNHGGPDSYGRELLHYPVVRLEVLHLVLATRPGCTSNSISEDVQRTMLA